jgi:hypothetical protein
MRPPPANRCSSGVMIIVNATIKPALDAEVLVTP